LFARAYITSSQKKKFTGHCLQVLDALFVPYDIEGLATLLDSPTMLAIREKFLYIGDAENQRRLNLIALLYREYSMSHENALLPQGFSFVPLCFSVWGFGVGSGWGLP